MRLSTILILTTIVFAHTEAFVNDTFLPSLTARGESDCGTFCRFRLCVLSSDGDFIPLPSGFTLPFGMPSTAEPPFICRLNVRIQPLGRVLRIREPRVRIRNDRLIRISRLRRSSLGRPFTPNFFSIRDILVNDVSPVSVVRRAKFRGMGQRRAMEGRCVILPLRRWEIRRRDGNRSRTIASRDRRNCVSFISTGASTQMRIQFMWDTAADLDIILTEPGEENFLLTFESNKSPGGGLFLQDVALGDCVGNGGARSSIEMIEYSGLSNPPEGSYTIDLRQFVSCEGLDTNWSLNVMIGDATILEKSGTVGPLGPEDGATIFKTLSFTFPDGEVVHEEDLAVTPE